MAMPWRRAKAKRAAILADTTGVMRANLTRLFDACFRIQREACAAAGRHIPMVVENVRGAQEWVGTSAWRHGSFHLWGNTPALMPIPAKKCGQKIRGDNSPRLWSERRVQRLADASRYEEDAFYCGSSGGKARKAASAMIAKIPLPLSRHIAAVYRP